MKKAKSSIKKYIKATDKIMLLTCMCASIYSCVLLFGLAQADKIDSSFWVKQALFSVTGVICALIISKIDYDFMANMWKLHLPVAVILNLLTFTSLGIQRVEYVDDRAWIKFPIIGTFQPSELLKLSFILAFALHLSLVYKKINKPKVLIPVCIHGAIPILLIHLQGDDGTAVIFGIIFIFMLFNAGLSYKYIGAGIGAVSVMVPIVWFFILSDDKKNRFLAVYNPQNSSKAIMWQQNMGKIAIGSGGVSGKGLGSQSYQLVPENHNDFIFSFIGEAFGFLGCLLIILLICIICFRIVYTFNIAEDPLGQNICVGIFAMIISQSVINIGMNLSLIPVIGVTLPLMSAGGSSVIVTYIGIGMVLSVYHRAKGNMFLE